MILKKGMIGTAVKTWQEFLNSQGFDCGLADGNFGNNTFNATEAFQTANNIDADGIAGHETIAVAENLGYDSSAHQATQPGNLTLEQLAYIMKSAKRSDVELYLPALNEQMPKYEINTPLRMQHFLAQLGTESGSLRYKHEIASGAAYEGRHHLGNTQPGDGTKYRGEGLIDITGRLNITSYAEYCGDLDLIDHPERIGNEPEHAVGSACWFWTVYKGLNKYADADNVKAVTLRVNGGYNGLADREQFLARAKEVIS